MSPPYADKAIAWHDIDPSAARGLFEIWTAARELEWAELAWQALSERNLNHYRGEVERHRVLGRLMVLATIYREFASLAWDETDEPEYTFWVDDLGLSKFRIAQAVGSDFLTAVDVDDDELLERAAITLVENERQVVVKALFQHFDNASMLFASLFATCWHPPSCDDDVYVGESEADEDGENAESGKVPQPTEPRITSILIDPNALHDILNEFEPNKMRAFEWIDQGMPRLFDL